MNVNSAVTSFLIPTLKYKHFLSTSTTSTSQSSFLTLHKPRQLGQQQHFLFAYMESDGPKQMFLPARSTAETLSH